MKIGRTILRPVAYLAGLHAARQARRFLRAHRRTRQVQDRLLAELLRRHRDTDFGRDHSFASIRTCEDFRSAVPVRSYEELRPYVQRVLDGRTDALVPPGERVLMFSLTSGTTGEPKYIPVTRAFLAEMQRGWNVFGWLALRDHPRAWLRPILQIASPMDDRRSPAGVPCGAISGLLAATQKRIVRRMYVVPPPVAAFADPQDKYYAVLRCGVGRDVGVLTTANPSSAIKLIETGQAHAGRLVRDVADGTLRPPGGSAGPEGLRFRPNPALARRLERAIARDGTLLPRHFWDVAMLLSWTGGTLGLYVPRLRELFGPSAALRDIGLLASEGRFSIPVADGTPAGLAEILGNFLEFIPADHRRSPRPDVLRADEVEVGKEYFLVFSNWTGLWRYDLDDRVRVVDRFGQSPVFEFLSRGLHTSSITGEKLTEHQVVEAMRRAGPSLKAPVDRFVVQGRFAPIPYYELRLEARPGLDLAALALRIDAELIALNLEYASKRKSDRLGAIRPVALPPGEMERAEREKIRLRRGRSEQYKHNYLLPDVLPG